MLLVEPVLGVEDMVPQKRNEMGYGFTRPDAGALRGFAAVPRLSSPLAKWAIIRCGRRINRDELFGPAFRDQHSGKRVMQVDDFTDAEVSKVQAVQSIGEFSGQPNIHEGEDNAKV